MKLGNFLRDRRKALDLSVKDVVDRLKCHGVEVSTKTIYSWEADHRQPDADTFLLLCQIYDVNSFSEVDQTINDKSDDLTPNKKIGQRLVKVREENGYTRKRLSEELGKPYATITKYETGEREPSHSYIVEIAKKFGVSADYILGIDDNTDTKKAPAVSAEAKHIARIFDSLDAHGKDMVKVVAERERARMEEESAAKTDMEAAPATKTIPLFGASFAAGKGEPDFGNMWEDYEVPVDTKADFR